MKKNKKRVKVFVTGAGCAVGQAILKSLNISEYKLNIFVGDISKTSIEFYLKNQILIPKVEQKKSLKWFINFFKKNKIDILFVGSEFEIEFFSKHKKEIEKKTDTLVCVSDYKDLVQTKDFLIKEIKSLLAGIEAEKLIFGEDLCSIGAYSDLRKATSIASNIVKNYGMSKYPALMSSEVESDNGVSYVKISDDSLEKNVHKILNDAKKDVSKILKKNKTFLLLLSERLINKSRIESNEIKEILEPLNIKWKVAKDLYNFRENLIEQIKKV